MTGRVRDATIVRDAMPGAAASTAATPGATGAQRASLAQRSKGGPVLLGWLRSLLRREDRVREDPAADMERARLRAEVDRDRDRSKDQALEAEVRTTSQGPLP